MILEKNSSFRGHTGEVLCVDVLVVSEQHGNHTRVKNVIASGTSSGELRVWKSQRLRAICKIDGTVPIVQVLWLPRWKCDPQREYVQTETHIPCIEDVTLVAQKKRERIIFYSIVPCELEYHLIPQYEMQTQLRAFTRLRSLAFRTVDNNHTEALFVPRDQETIRFLLPSPLEQNCDLPSSKAPHVFDLLMTRNEGKNNGEMMVFTPFTSVKSDESPKAANLSVFAGYESGKACFWSVSWCLDGLPQEKTMCTLDQEFDLSDKPILCSAVYSKPNANERIRIAMGTVDGKIAIFEQSTANSAVSPWFTKGTTIIGHGTGCSVNDMSFDDCGAHIVTVSRDSTIRCFRVETVDLLCSLSLSCLSISHGLNRTNGLHCIAMHRDQSEQNPYTSNLLSTHTAMSLSCSWQGNNQSTLAFHQGRILTSFIIGGSEGRLLLIRLAQTE